MTIIRGAVRAENSKQSIDKNAVALIKEIISQNSLSASDIACIFFSATADLTAANPATAVRTTILPDCAFMCFAEMPVDGAMPRVIRAAVFVNAEISPKFCYLGETANLR